MFNKLAVLTLAVIAFFATAAWSVGPIDLGAACADRDDSLLEKLEWHTELTRRRAPDLQGDAREGSTLELRFAYDELLKESQPR